MTVDLMLFERQYCCPAVPAARAVGVKSKQIYGRAPVSRPPRRELAVPTGFEPAISTLTGWHVKPGYTTGPQSDTAHQAVGGTRGSTPTLQADI
jgi:hypothetical protein